MVKKKAILELFFCLQPTWRWRGCQPGCWVVTSDLPCLLLLFSRCSLRRRFSSLLAWPRLHFLILHFFLWMVSEHGSPPNCGSSVTERVRMVWPFPQDLLHSDHSVHSDMTQSMAEGRQEGWGFRDGYRKIFLTNDFKIFYVCHRK